MSQGEFITPEVVVGTVAAGLALIFFGVKGFKYLKKEIIIRRAMNNVIKGYRAHVKRMEGNKPL